MRKGWDRGRDRVRLGILATHPIQYFAPLYRRLARSEVVDITVVFLSDFGVKESYDPGYGRSLTYDVPLTEGYPHTFLRTGVLVPPSRYRFPPLGYYRMLLRRTFDVVMVPGYATVPSLSTCVAAVAANTEYLMRGETNEFSDRRRSSAGLHLKRALLRQVFGHAAACVAIGTSNERFYRAYGVPATRIVLAPYSVDNDYFSEHSRVEKREKVLNDLGLDASLPTVLFAGKLSDKKRPLDLIQAVRLLKSPANLLVVGDGPLRERVESGLTHLTNATMLGFTNQSGMGRLYGASDLIVLPSSHEPWGLVVNEAMACGVVPVVSDVVGCGPDLAGRESGAVFPAGDVPALAGTIENLLADPIRLEKMKGKAREIIQSFSIDRTAEGIERAALLSVST